MKHLDEDTIFNQALKKQEEKDIKSAFELYKKVLEINPAHLEALSNIGNILYEEGLVVIKTPHLPLFGKDTFTAKFEGDRTVYVLEINIPAERSTGDISTNPAFKALKPSDYVNELSDRFSYLTGVQLHDDNLNVIMRINFACSNNLNKFLMLSCVVIYKLFIMSS